MSSAYGHSNPTFFILRRSERKGPRRVARQDESTEACSEGARGNLHVQLPTRSDHNFLDVHAHLEQVIETLYSTAL